MANSELCRPDCPSRKDVLTSCEDCRLQLSPSSGSASAAASRPKVKPFLEQPASGNCARLGYKGPPISAWWRTALTNNAHPRAPCQVGWGTTGLHQSSTPSLYPDLFSLPFFYRDWSQINILHPKLSVSREFDLQHDKKKRAYASIFLVWWHKYQKWTFNEQHKTVLIDSSLYLPIFNGAMSEGNLCA